MIQILPLATALPETIETLLDDAFGADRHKRTAYRIRTGMHPIPALSFAAYDDERLVGTIQCWPIELSSPDGRGFPLILVGPVAVMPDQQRKGIGHQLMQATLKAANGKENLVLIGDPEYYGRFYGFSADPTRQWQVPGPVERHRLLALLSSDKKANASGMLGPRSQSPLYQPIPGTSASTENLRSVDQLD